MQVEVVRAFAGPDGSFTEGDVTTLPEGADWVRAGLAVPVEESTEEKKPAEEEVSFDDLPRSSLLQDAGYGTAGAVRSASDDDLLAIDGIGAATVRDIRSILG